jgi:hypothetical protein
MSPPCNRIEQDMTMALTADQVPPAPRRALRILLIVLAAILTFGALKDLPLAFHDYGHTKPLVIFAQRLTSAKILLLPPISGAALLLAISGRVRYAIMALGAVMLVEWAHDLPSLAIHGLPSGLITLAQTFIYPGIAVAAIWLAMRNRLLGLAVAFVAVPTVEYWAGATAFAIAVMIYGF